MADYRSMVELLQRYLPEGGMPPPTIPLPRNDPRRGPTYLTPEQLADFNRNQQTDTLLRHGAPQWSPGSWVPMRRPYRQGQEPIDKWQYWNPPPRWDKPVFPRSDAAKEFEF